MWPWWPKRRDQELKRRRHHVEEMVVLPLEALHYLWVGKVQNAYWAHSGNHRCAMARKVMGFATYLKAVGAVLADLSLMVPYCQVPMRA